MQLFYFSLVLMVFVCGVDALKLKKFGFLQRIAGGTVTMSEVFSPEPGAMSILRGGFTSVRNDLSLHHSKLGLQVLFHLHRYLFYHFSVILFVWFLGIGGADFL